jgi:uncharacterized protein (TIGR02186 family)
MTRFITYLAALMLFALPASAQSEAIVAGLSQNRVAITATFVGSEILIFGAIKRDAPAPDTDLGVTVVIEGPSEPITVRRKEKRMGIWVNVDAVEVDFAPTFYAIATSGPFDELITPEIDSVRRISIPASISIMHDEGNPDVASFAEAVIRIRSKNGLYRMQEGAVRIEQDTLFDTRIELPANLTEGVYAARIYLTRDGVVVANHTAYIDVQKVGLERWIYSLAHEQAFLYGLMSLAIAIAAGWGASAAFRLILRN